jgi:SnoaL-like domain
MAINNDDLEDLLARQQIMDCMNRYTRGVDRVDEELIRSAYHDDAIDFHGDVNGSVDDFLAWWLPFQPEREVSQHYVSNISIDRDGDLAHMESYWTFYHKRLGDPTMTVTGGRYVDRYERREIGWRIAVRVVIIEWSMTADGTPTTARLAAQSRGRRDRQDPSYARPLVGV